VLVSGRLADLSRFLLVYSVLLQGVARSGHIPCNTTAATVGKGSVTTSGEVKVGSPDKLIVDLGKILRHSDRRLAKYMLVAIAPILEPALQRYSLKQAEICDRQSTAMRNEAPETAAELHRLAAELRDLAHRP
jgi:hypothetical protein